MTSINEQTARAFFADYLRKGWNYARAKYCTDDCIFWVLGLREMQDNLEVARDMLTSVLDEKGLQVFFTGVTDGGAGLQWRAILSRR